MKNRTTPTLVLIAAVTATIAIAPAAARSPLLRTVALSNQPAPGIGAPFSGFVNPRIASDGGAAFFANVGATQGIWSERTGSLQLVARTGTTAPGTDGAQYAMLFDGGFANPANLGLDADGHVYFKAFLVGGDVVDADFTGIPENHTGYWTDRGGALALLARNGDHAPGFAPSITFDTMNDSIRVSPNGVAGATMFLRGPGVGFNFFTIYTHEGDGLQLVAHQSDPAPLAGAFLGTTTLTGFGADDDLSFVCGLTGPGVTALTDSGLFTVHSGVTRLKIQEGAPAPEAGAGVTIDLASGKNRSTVAGNQVAVTLRLRSATGLVDAEAIYFSDAADQLHLLARSDTQAPGLDPGVNFDFFGFFDEHDPLALNAAGDVAFWARLTGGPSTFQDNEALWLAVKGGTPHLVARKGQQPPGAPAGVVFNNGFTFFPTFQTPTLNDHGQLAFKARLVGGGLDPFSASGLYLTDLDGTLHKIAQTGDVVDVAGDGRDLRTVQSVFFNGDELPQMNFNGLALNDDGALVFILTFTDGSSGVFTASLDDRPPAPAADLDGDGDVDGIDLASLLAAWGRCPKAGACPADLNNDGIVNGFDLAMLLAEWGPVG